MRQEVSNLATVAIEEPREAPHNLEAEQALLGAILLNNNVLDRVSDILDQGHFYDPLHGLIYRYSSMLYAQGRVVTPVTLKDYFTSDPMVGALTVSQYLGGLAAKATTIINSVEYAKTIKNLSLRRSIIIVAEDLLQGAFEGHIEMSPDELVEEAEARLYEIAETGQASKSDIHISEALNKAYEAAKQAYENKGSVCGISSGIDALDRLTGGFKKSDLIILAGRPGMGKTAIAANIAKSAGLKNIPIGIFSLEMSDEQLGTRLLSDFSGLSSSDMNNGGISEAELHSLANSRDAMSDMPMRIDVSGGLSISHLAQKARRWKRKHDIQILFIDYLQLMKGSRRHGNRTEEVTEISKGLKTLAKELDIPIIALSQLSRNVENRDNKRPNLADLRESGSIEQDADIVLFIYREEYYHMKEEPDIGNADKYVDWQRKLTDIRGISEVIQDKHRHSSTGKVKLYFDAKTTKFSGLEDRRNPDA